MTDKKTEKLLKKPDAFQTFFFHAFNWFKTSQKTLLLTVIPILGIILAGIAWQYYRHWERDQRKYQLAEIEKVFSKEEKEPNKKKADLRAEIRKLEKAAKDAGKEADKTVIEAKNKAIEAIVPDHKDSLAKYLAFFQANEKSPEGWRAGMSAVGILTKAKNYLEASQILTKILTHTQGIEFYQVQVRLYSIAVMEDLKKFDEGLVEIEKVIPLASAENLPRILLTKARFQMEAGRKDDAWKTLDGIIANHSSSPEARQAMAIKAL